MAISDRKLISIRSILRNETYQTDSGLYQRLELALSKLPADALADLNMLITQKQIEASRRVRDEIAAEEGRREMLAASYGPTPLG